jgi:hypothetical protein
VLPGSPSTSKNWIYHIGTNTSTQSSSKVYNDRSDEESWVRLPDGRVMTYFKDPLLLEASIPILKLGRARTRAAECKEKLHGIQIALCHRFDIPEPRLLVRALRVQDL